MALPLRKPQRMYEEMEEISRPTKTMRSSVEQVMSIMPTAPKRDEGEVLAGVSVGAVEEVQRAEKGDDDDGGDEEMEEDGEGVDLEGAGEGGDAERGRCWVQRSW